MKEIYDKYYTFLFLFAYKIIGDKEEAEDIVIECFIKFYKGSYQQIDNPKSFLFTAVKNSCINFLRKRKLRRSKEIEYMGISEVSDPPTWYEVENNILASIHKAIEALPGRQKEIIRMYLVGNSTQEIAAELNIGPASVRSLKRFSIDKIKNSLCNQQK